MWDTRSRSKRAEYRKMRSAALTPNVAVHGKNTKNKGAAVAAVRIAPVGDGMDR